MCIERISGLYYSQSVFAFGGLFKESIYRWPEYKKGLTMETDIIILFASDYIQRTIFSVILTYCMEKDEESIVCLWNN